MSHIENCDTMISNLYICLWYLWFFVFLIVFCLVIFVFCLVIFVFCLVIFVFLLFCYMCFFVGTPTCIKPVISPPRLLHEGIGKLLDQKEKWDNIKIVLLKMLSLLKKTITGPGPLLACPAPGVDHLLRLLHGLAAGVEHLLLPAPLLLWFEWVWPDATHFWSSGALPCGWKCKSPPLHTLWTAFCKLLESWIRSNLQKFCLLLFLHVSFLNACRKQTLP